MFVDREVPRSQCLRGGGLRLETTWNQTYIENGRLTYTLSCVFSLGLCIRPLVIRWVLGLLDQYFTDFNQPDMDNLRAQSYQIHSLRVKVSYNSFRHPVEGGEVKPADILYIVWFSGQGKELSPRSRGPMFPLNCQGKLSEPPRVSEDSIRWDSGSSALFSIRRQWVVCDPPLSSLYGHHRTQLCYSRETSSHSC